MKKMQNWLVIGIPKNWETALSQPVPIWGLKLRYQAEFQALNIGDLLWFYCTSSPIAGVIGMGTVKDKYVDNVNLTWEEELKKKEIIWPLRFRIHVLKVLPKNLWRTNKVKINDFDLFWQVGFQPLKDAHVTELHNRTKESFGIADLENLFVGSTIIQPSIVRETQTLYLPQEKGLVFPHKELQDQIAEIGKLQFYYTEIEHSIELTGERKSLDVVWKREIDGVPTYAFEVELSGMIEKAIERLKFAFRKWNSQPRVIVPKEFMKKAHNIIGATNKDFSSQIKIYEPLQISELLNQKRTLKRLEQTLDLY